MKKNIILIVSAMCLIGCWRVAESPMGALFVESFVHRYVDFENTFWEFDVTTKTLYMAVADSRPDEASHADCAYWMGSRCWDMECCQEQCLLYRQLSEKNNDTAYNRRIAKEEQFDIAAIGHNFTKIDIVSNADFDENHPAGCSLADMVMLTYGTYKPYIDSGYYEKHSAPWYYNLANNCTVKSAMLCDLGLSDLSVLRVKCFRKGVINNVKLNDDFQFTFETLPTLEQQHTLDIVFVSDEDEEFRFKVDVDFAGSSNKEI